MKRVILILIGLLVILSGFYLAKLTDVNNDAEREIIETETNTTFSDKNLGIFIEIFDNIHSLEYTENTKLLNTEEYYDELNNPLAIINGGYFLQDYSHAGFYYKNNEVIIEDATNDKQLNGYVKINETVDITDDLSTFNLDNTIFQTGPVVVLEDIIQKDYIDISINGNTLHRRSLIGVTDDNRFFLVATSKAYDLKKLSEIIINLDLFSDTKIDLINLDGGSSVSFISKNDIKIGEKKKLPFFIAVY